MIFKFFYKMKSFWEQYKKMSQGYNILAQKESKYFKNVNINIPWRSQGSMVIDFWVNTKKIKSMFSKIGFA